MKGNTAHRDFDEEEFDKEHVNVEQRPGSDHNTTSAIPGYDYSSPNNPMLKKHSLRMIEPVAKISCLYRLDCVARATCKRERSR